MTRSGGNAGPTWEAQGEGPPLCPSDEVICSTYMCMIPDSAFPQLGFCRENMHSQRASVQVVSTPSQSVVKCLLPLVCALCRPEDIVRAYLRRPLLGYSFRQGIELLASGKVPRGSNVREISEREIVARAHTVLRWLDGEECDHKDPYQVLGLSRAATDAQIHHRYRTLSKRVHPDRHSPQGQDYWGERQREVTEAYRLLSDLKSRQQYLDGLERRKRLLRRLWKVEAAVGEKK